MRIVSETARDILHDQACRFNQPELLDLDFADLLEILDEKNVQKEKLALDFDFNIDMTPLQGLSEKELLSPEENFESISLAVFDSVGSLPALRINDQNFWLTLALDNFSDLARNRWPAYSDKSFETKEKNGQGTQYSKGATVIRNHWFAQGRGGLRRDQVIANYWLLGKLASEISEATGWTRPETSKLLNWNSDFKSHLLTRENISGSRNLLIAILRLAKSEIAAGRDYKRQDVRNLLKNLNLKLGRKALYTMNETDLSAVINSEWSLVKK